MVAVVPSGVLKNRYSCYHYLIRAHREYTNDEKDIDRDHEKKDLPEEFELDKRRKIGVEVEIGSSSTLFRGRQSLAGGRPRQQKMFGQYLTSSHQI